VTDRSFAALARAVVEEQVPPLKDLVTPAKMMLVNPATPHVSYGLTLTREQHRFLRRFAMQRSVPASVVVRRLLRLLEDDRYVSAMLSGVEDDRRAVRVHPVIAGSAWTLP
jgi:hypothetical protein